MAAEETVKVAGRGQRLRQPRVAPELQAGRNRQREGTRRRGAGRGSEAYARYLSHEEAALHLPRADREGLKGQRGADSVGDISVDFVSSFSH